MSQELGHGPLAVAVWAAVLSTGCPSEPFPCPSATLSRSPATGGELLVRNSRGVAHVDLRDGGTEDGYAVAGWVGNRIDLEEGVGDVEFVDWVSVGTSIDGLPVALDFRLGDPRRWDAGTTFPDDFLRVYRITLARTETIVGRQVTEEPRADCRRLIEEIQLDAIRRGCGLRATSARNPSARVANEPHR